MMIFLSDSCLDSVMMLISWLFFSCIMLSSKTMNLITLQMINQYHYFKFSICFLNSWFNCLSDSSLYSKSSFCCLISNCSLSIVCLNLKISLFVVILEFIRLAGGLFCGGIIILGVCV